MKSNVTTASDHKVMHYRVWVFDKKRLPHTPISGKLTFQQSIDCLKREAAEHKDETLGVVCCKNGAVIFL